MEWISIDQPFWSGFLPGLALDHESVGIIFLIAAAAAITFYRKPLRWRGTSNRRKSKSGPGLFPAPAWERTDLYSRPPMNDLSDPKNQMDAIAHIDFELVPLLNKEEARLLPLLETCVRRSGCGHRVMAQTSMGEIIRPRTGQFSKEQRNAAYASINSKRLDFSIIDRFGKLVLAIEYQGSGHFQTKTFMRDAVKREVLRKAGVPFLEVHKSFRHDELTRQIASIIGPPENDATSPPYLPR